MLGEVGRVYAVYPGGDVTVMVKGKSWVFNPLCLTHTSNMKKEEGSDNPSEYHIISLCTPPISHTH